MTKEEAIIRLKGLYGNGYTEQEQALDMAIESLKQEPCDDCISRQTAIAHAVPLNLFGREVMMVSVSELENLPSAQPEIIRCKDCKFYIPMNRETKTGICNLIMHQNFGDNWFCAGAERRTDG